jgi:transcriptional regulatory protein LevR
MQRLPQALSALSEHLAALELSLEDRHQQVSQETDLQREALQQSRAREANALALSQKVAARLDHAIARIEHILKDTSPAVGS